MWILLVLSLEPRILKSSLLGQFFLFQNSQYHTGKWLLVKLQCTLACTLTFWFTDTEFPLSIDLNMQTQMVQAPKSVDPF